MIPGIKCPSLELDANLPPGQKRVLLEIGFMQANNKPITVRGLMAATGSRFPNSVHGHLRRLRKKGYITWAIGQCGTIHLTRPLTFKEVPPFRRAPIVENPELDLDPTTPIYSPFGGSVV